MTEQPESEPTLADVLSEIRAMRTELQDVRTELQDTRADLTHRADRTDATLSQIRADLAAVAVDAAYTEAHIGDHQDAIRRHIDDPHAHRRAA